MDISFASHYPEPSFLHLSGRPASFNHNANATSAVFQEISALRYEVYCLERGYIDPELHPSCLEIDQYDIRSTHIAAHTRDKLLVGTVRLVRSAHNQSFPFEAHCQLSDDFDFPPRAQCGEVSRLVVRKNFRGGSGTSFPERRISLVAEQPPYVRGERRSSSAEILLGLYREMYRYSRKAGIRYWFAAMERPLARSLSQMGFRFEPVGPEADYSGPVIPYLADLDQLAAVLGTANPSLSTWFNAEPL